MNKREFINKWAVKFFEFNFWYNNAKEYIQDLDQLIQEDKWIPVEDELPEYSQSVLVRVFPNHYPASKQTLVGHLTKNTENKNIWALNTVSLSMWEDKDNFTVTHWRYIKPPTEEK